MKTEALRHPRVLGGEQFVCVCVLGGLVCHCGLPATTSEGQNKQALN